MLLRLIVLVLTVANLVYFGWTEGWLDGVVGAKSTGEREPARADAQVRPELMALSDGRAIITAGVTAGIAPASAASSASAPASTGAIAAAASAVPAPRHAASQEAASGPLSSSVTTGGAPAASSVAPSPASAAIAASTSSPSTATGTLSAAKPTASSSPAPHTAASAAPAPATASANSGAASATLANSAAGSPGPAVCLQSGPYPVKEAAAAETAFKTVLPPGGWSRVAVDKPGVWMIYMGRFTDNEARRKKEGELSRRNATFEEIEAPAEFAKGLSLGRFASRADAEKGLAELNKQGVHTARIVVFQAPVQSALLRVEKADPATADRLKALRTSLPVVDCQL